MTAAEEKVVHLRHADEAREKVFNCTITFNLGKAAQATILTDFPQSIAEDALDENLEKLARVSRRQQAKYEIRELEQGIEQAEEQMETWRADHDEAERAYKGDGEHQRKIALADAKVEEAIRRRTADEMQMRADWDKTGKRADFEPSKRQEANLSALDRVIADARKARADLDKERSTALDNLNVNLRNQERHIAKLRKQIAKKQKALEAGA